MANPLPLKRLFAWLVVALALCYAALCGVLYSLQRVVLYHPRPLLFEPDAQAITIPVGSGTLRGWVVNPRNRRAVIYCGGNGESVERDVDFFRTTLPEFSVYLVPYRGYGPNAGTPTQAGIESDELAVYDFVHARHARISLIGRSLGTGVATYVASHRLIDKLALITPYDSILNIARRRYGIFPVGLLLQDPYESWRNVQKIKGPVLVILGEDDEIIPRTSSDALMAHIHPAPEVVVIPRAGHNNLSNSPMYAQAITGFLRDPQAPQPVQPFPRR